MRNHLLLALAVLILPAFLAGCTAPQPPAPVPPHQNVSVPIPLYQNVSTLTDAHNALGFKMIQALTRADSGKNVFISPTSISLALTMAYDGAAGQTRDAMAATMEINSLDPNSIDNQSLYLMRSLTGRPNTTLSIADSIWLNNDLQLNPRYQSEVETYFDARASVLDFSSPASAKTINDWVGNKTNGRIDSIVQPPLDQVKAVLVNAVYFKGKWEAAFNKSETHDGDFTTGDGRGIKVPMMSRSGKFNYLETDGFQAIELPYNDNLSMYVFLPRQSLLSNPKIEDFVQGMNQSTWSAWLSQFRQQQGTILLPRFKTTYSATLNQPLTDSGMGNAFSDNADFSLMSPTPLKIDKVIHKTFVETDEEGSEAAGVTAVVMVATSIPVQPGPQPFYMKADYPFFYAIYDKQTGSILFMGVMNEAGDTAS